MDKMGKKLKDTRERKIQRSIAFCNRQLEFFNEYPDFKPDEYCRDIIDIQIAQINPTYLAIEDERRP